MWDSNRCVKLLDGQPWTLKRSAGVHGPSGTSAWRPWSSTFGRRSKNGSPPLPIVNNAQASPSRS